METKKELKEELMNAKLRAGRHFDKLMEIRQIIQKADERHEMAIFTIKDIKRVLSMT